MSVPKGLQVEDLRREAEAMRLNFLSGEVIFYDNQLSAWSNGQGKYFVSRNCSVYTAHSLLEAIRLLIWCLRAE